MTAVDPELLAVFRDEVSEALETISSLLGRMESADDDEADALLEGILRSAHNVKGAARFAGAEPIELLAHAFEDRLSRATGAGLIADEPLLVLIRRSLRRIADVLEGSAEPAELLQLAAEMSDGVLGDLADREPSDQPTGTRRAEGDQRDLATVRVDAARVERLMAMTGELFTVRARFGDRHQRLAAFCDALRDSRRATDAEARASVEAVVREMETLLDRDRHELQRLGFFAEEFGESVKSIRMQPLRRSIPALARAVANLAEDLGKEARFGAEVGDIEIDRHILDALRDPLLHLLRNAVDHGLEPAAERAAAGKDPIGTIRLTARSAGPMVELDVADDGRGIDVEAVADRAARDGVVEAEQLAAMDAERRMDLVFASGVSTAREVSRLSGRGVGLDVVRSRVTQLGGRVWASSSRGGTTFHLVVPATAVSTTGLVVRCGEVAYALPVAHVLRTIRVASSEVRTADGGAAIERPGGEPLRLRWLASLMGLPRTEDPPHLTVAIVAHLGAQLGLVVGSLVGEMQFVMKRLPWNIERAPAVAGAVVSGDGSVALVVDVPQLFVASHRRESADDSSVRSAAEGRPRRVLVVDDSLTSRTLERNILTAAGYEVEVAVDGEAAWRLLESHTFDLVVSDVQMPHLDGIGLTRRIRAHAGTERLPVILVTSLDRPEDVAAGSEAGADEYIVKGQFDQRKLLEAVARHV